MKKKICALAALACSAMMSFTALAGQWQMDQIGWWWSNGDGTYPTNCWQWLDGNGDGVAECYYFDQNGYMLANAITPDGNLVNSEGAWIVNGAIQRQSNVGGVPYKNQLDQFLAGTYQFQTYDIHNPGDLYTVTGNVMDAYKEDDLGMSWSGTPIEMDDYFIFKNVIITCTYWNNDPEDIYYIPELYVRKSGIYTYYGETTTYTLNEFLNSTTESRGRWGLKFDSEGYVIALEDGIVG